MDTETYRYEFGGFSLDRRTWSLVGPGGAPVRLTPKAFDALLFLLEHPGEVIDRETLYHALWPNSVVEENNLRQVIAALRRAIGNELIRTVPRRGYQLVAEVRVVAVGRSSERLQAPNESSRMEAAQPRMYRFSLISAAILALIVSFFWYFTKQAQGPAQDFRPMLAVLPFADTSAQGDLEHVADAIALELITTLSLIEGLDVPGSTSSFYFKDNPADLSTIRQLLQADYVLEGDVRSANESLRVSVRLTDASNGAQIWSERYDGSIDDFFRLQDDIALSVAQALEIALGVGARGTRLGTTGNVAAYFQFLEAERILSAGNAFAPADVRSAIPHLEQAVALDENFALGWFQLYWQLRWLEILGAGSISTAERAAFALQRVEELTPNLPELVFAKIQTSTDAFELARIFEQFLLDATKSKYPPAIVLNMEARFLRFTGRVSESMLAAERARAFDPLNETLVRFIADGYAAEGRYDDALDLLDEFARQTDSVPGPAAFTISLVTGDPNEIAKRVAPLLDSPVEIVRALAENIDEPEQALERLREFTVSPKPAMMLWPTQLAPWAAYFGDAELALEMYKHEVTYATGNTISNPIFAEMRRLPGFKLLVRDIGLLSYWRESGNWPDYCRTAGSEDFECF